MGVNWRLRLLAGSVAILFGACNDLGGEERVLSPVDKGTFILYVSNQSYALDPVDIRVYIDGSLAVNQDFYVQGQHNWIKFEYDLATSNHRILVVSSTGATQLEKSFMLTAQCWCVIDFWYCPGVAEGEEPTPKSFEIQFFDEPVVFM